MIAHSFSISPGLERNAFDNKHVTFEEHIRYEHNMWHYLYFIVLIKVKDPTEFTGPESYVHQMVKVGSKKHEDLILKRERYPVDEGRPFYSFLKIKRAWERKN